MKFGMSVHTKRYEIAFFIVPQEASRLNVMDLKPLRRATVLAAPAVTVQYLLP